MFADLWEEQPQGYELLKKRRKEEFEECKKKLEAKYKEDLHEFLACLKKGHQDNITQVG
jgi:hypothetical protein